MKQIFRLLESKRNHFSKSLNIVANYFYRNPHVFAMNSARSVAKEIGVSETTIIRFTNELGYSGYSAFQNEVQSNLYNKSSLSGILDSKVIDDNADNPIKHLIMREITVIGKIVEQIDESLLESTVEKILTANHILTIGMQSSHAFASWFAFALDVVRGNARMYQLGVDNPLLRIKELSNEGLLFAFSFHRYAAHTIEIAKLAKEHNVHVIGFTDSPIAPISNYTDILIPVKLPVKSTIDIAPSIFTILSSLISMISLKDQVNFEQRIEQIDSMEAMDLFSTKFSEKNSKKEEK